MPNEYFVLKKAALFSNACANTINQINTIKV